ncbi:glucosamine-6-phosphate deaminase [Shimazuella kribbensis]|uniref:glucosamine-6-phosphate deaminase n=1 Tax=Shimazuella kribbensis TaxID=139808 RepID=UPI0004002DD1|nr:glucosamine-6-phosphate deaminase [Shimazuella kribbensis]
MIQLAIFEDYQTLSRQAAIYIADRIKQKPNTILGLATGSTPLGLYEELVSLHKAKKVNFSEVVTFNLDEYASLPKEHPQSYYYFMQQHLFSKVNIQLHNIHFPEGMFHDANHACQLYEQQLLENGPIDLQILGIGSNGHIGFNEPADRMTLQTHITDLADRTIVDNARFFNDETEVPRKAITMGIGSIMKAKTILLLANNETKTAALNALFSGVIDPNIPASILQLHENVLVFVNSDVAKHLKYRPTALMNK